MGSTPRFKVYHPERGYIASIKDATDAAAFACLQGPGTSVRLGHAKTMELLRIQPNEDRSYDEMGEDILRSIGVI